MFILIIIAVVLLASFIAAVCTKGSGLASRQEEYLEECEMNRKGHQQNNIELMLEQCNYCARCDESGKYCFAYGVEKQITLKVRRDCRNWYLFTPKKGGEK